MLRRLFGLRAEGFKIYSNFRATVTGLNSNNNNSKNCINSNNRSSNKNSHNDSNRNIKLSKPAIRCPG